jgi:probable HAF family extracellular repeat protein
MTNRSMIPKTALMFCVCVLFPVAQWAQPPRYSVKRLAPAEGPSAVAYSINSAGQVAGGSGAAHAPSAVGMVWDGTNMRAIRGSAHSGYTALYGINLAQRGVGSTNTDSALRAFTWTPDKGMLLLPVLPGDNSSEAFAINDAGVIAGFSGGPSGLRAVLWIGGTARRLGSLPGSDHSEAAGLNSTGDAAGFSDGADGRRAILWPKSGAIRDLGVLPGDVSSYASAINNARQVVGTSEGQNGSRAFLWSESEGMQNLGTLPGGAHSRAAGINASGQVVGSSDSSFGQRAFLWTQSSGLVDLNSLIPADSNVILSGVSGINDAGQIVALGGVGHDLSHDRAADFDDHAHGGLVYVFLLTPVR